MKLCKLELNNFITYSILTFEFVNGIWLIVGKNGAGKSAIFDGLVWVLFGKTRGDVDSVIKDGEKKCSGILTFKVKNEEYKIKRIRDRNGRTFLFFYLISSEETRGMDLASPTVAETQIKIEKFLGMDYDIFISSVYFEQQKIDEFMKKTPSQRKDLFFDMLGLNIYKLAEKKVKENIVSVNSKIDIDEGKELFLLDGLKGLKFEEDNIIYDKEEYDKLKKNIDILKDKLEIINGEYLNKLSLKNNLKMIKQYYTEQDKCSMESLEYEKNFNEIKKDILKIDVKLKAVSIKDIKYRLVQLKNKGRVCPTCGAILKNEKTERDINNIEEQLRNIEKFKTKRKGLVWQKNVLDTSLKKCKNREVEIKIWLKKYEKDKGLSLQQINAQVVKLFDRIFIIKKDIKTMQDKMTEMLISKSEIEKNKSKKICLKRGLQEVKIRKESSIKDLEKLNILQQAFSKNGIPAYIIENILPDLEEKANKVLNRIFNEPIEIHFKIQKETKSKKIKDTLDIIINDGERDKDYNTYSGGEKVRINMAIRLAMADLISEGANISLKFLLIDEVGFLDEDGLECFAGLLKELNKIFKTIIVISHIEKIKSLFNNVLMVEKGVNDSVIKRIR